MCGTMKIFNGHKFNCTSLPKKLCFVAPMIRTQWIWILLPIFYKSPTNKTVIQIKKIWTKLTKGEHLEGLKSGYWCKMSNL